MAFRFPLQAVLRFRQSVEHQQELRMRAANQQLARARRLLDQVDDRIRHSQLEEAQRLCAGTTSAELQLALLREASLREQRQAAERDLLRWQNLRDQQQQIFQQARRDRETLDHLRQHQLREYERDASRLEQRHIDDLFLLRQFHLHRG